MKKLLVILLIYKLTSEIICLFRSIFSHMEFVKYREEVVEFAHPYLRKMIKFSKTKIVLLPAFLRNK